MTVDPQRSAIVYSYDPALITDAQIEILARADSGAFQERWQTCTLQLNREGGRLCETCSVRLERSVQAMPGVRRATASYLGGALSVTFDQTQLSDSGLLAALRRLGARVRPLTAKCIVNTSNAEFSGLCRSRRRLGSSWFVFQSWIFSWGCVCSAQNNCP